MPRCLCVDGGVRQQHTFHRVAAVQESLISDAPQAGFSARTARQADAAFFTPCSAPSSVCMTWRWRFDRSAASPSIICRRPTPAPARYRMALHPARRQPRAPAPCGAHCALGPQRRGQHLPGVTLDWRRSSWEKPGPLHHTMRKKRAALVSSLGRVKKKKKKKKKGGAPRRDATHGEGERGELEPKP